MTDSKTKLDIWKIITGLLTTAVIGGFGWIIKVEVKLSQAVSDVEDLEDDIKDLEKDLADAKSIADEVRDNKIDLTAVQGIVKSIEGKVDDIKRAIERANHN